MSKTVHDVRLSALRGVLKKYPSVVAFCKSAGLNPAYISQVLNGHRNMGSGYARKIEKHEGFPTGALDAPELDAATTLASLSEKELLEVFQIAAPDLSQEAAQQLIVILLSRLTSSGHGQNE